MFRDFFQRKGEKVRAALFLSGQGTNAENLLEFRLKTPESAWEPVVMVTDRPETSAAGKLAEKYDLPLVELDIREFYRKNGMERVSIATEEGMRIRHEWTAGLRRLLLPYRIDFGVMAGFVPLTNIVEDFPCLNVHPGDLTIEEKGSRILAGLHCVPIETAILKRHKSLRSSVIVVQPFTPGASEMDSGPIIGISAPVLLDLKGSTYEELEEVYRRREGKAKAEASNDLLAQVAAWNLECLKRNGDWIVLPPSVEDFAAGKFLLDDENGLVRKENDAYIKLKTVEYISAAENNPVPR